MIRRAAGWALLVVAGAAFYFAVEHPGKAAAVVAGSVIVNIGVDMAIVEVRENKDRR